MKRVYLFVLVLSYGGSGTICSAAEQSVAREHDVVRNALREALETYDTLRTAGLADNLLEQASRYRNSITRIWVNISKGKKELTQKDLETVDRALSAMRALHAQLAQKWQEFEEIDPAE